MSDWLGIVFRLAQVTYGHGRDGKWGVLRAQERSDVLWAHWEDKDGTPHARGIRGRDLTAPDLRRAVQVVEDEDRAVSFAESFGDEIPLFDDGRTLVLPEPAVPDHHVAMLLAGRFLTCNGRRLEAAQGAQA